MTHSGQVFSVNIDPNLYEGYGVTWPNDHKFLINDISDEFTVRDLNGNSVRLVDLVGNFGDGSIPIVTNDTFTIAEEPSKLDLSGDMTLEAWIKPDSFDTEFQTVFAKVYSHPSDNWAYGIYKFGGDDELAIAGYPTGILEADWNAAQRATSLSKNEIFDGGWHHVSYVISDTPQMAKNLEIGSPVGIRANAVDADTEDNEVTYHLTDTEGWFDINQSTGEVTLAEDVSEQPAGRYDVEVEARSSDGSSSRTTFSVDLIDPPINFVDGTSSDDQLDGTSGIDYIRGFAGSDQLNGGDGDDVYIYNSSDAGFDTINDSSGFDTIKFDVNGSGSWGTPYKDGDDLVYVNSNEDGGFRVVDHFNGSPIEMFEYESQGYSVLTRTTSNTPVSTDAYDEAIFGTAGVDNLVIPGGDNVWNDEVMDLMATMSLQPSVAIPGSRAVPVMM